jgi:hypothetical protein
MKTNEKLDVEFHAFSSLMASCNIGILLPGKVPYLPITQDAGLYCGKGKNI